MRARKHRGSGGPLLLAAAALLVLGVEALPAATCAWSCDDHGLCRGGCKIDAAPGCGVACHGTPCRYYCDQIGPDECPWQISGQCDRTNPGGGPQGLGWALLEQVRIGDSAPSLFAVKGSSQEFMAAAQAEHSGELVRRQQARPAKELASRLSPRVPVLFVGPQEGTRCVEYGAALNNRKILDVDRGATVVVRAETRGGSVETLQILDSRLPAFDRQLSDFIRENLRVWSPAGHDRLEVIAMVQVGEGGGVGYGIAGVAAVEPSR